MKVLLRDNNGVCECFKRFLTLESNLLKADKVVVWNDLVGAEKRIVEMAKEYGKESIIIEHGMKAITDYQKNLYDNIWRMGGKTLIADKICVWGKVSADILLEAGISKDRVFTVGSPIVWNYEYKYNCGDDERVVPWFGGKTILDKTDGREWKLTGHRQYIPKHEESKYVLFFPFHDFTTYGAENNRRIWNQIKHRDDVVIKLSTPYARDDSSNPFQEIVQYEQKRAELIREKTNDELAGRVSNVKEIPPPKGFIADIRKPMSVALNKRLLAKASVAVMGAPGTTNGIAWAIGVPTIVPKIDWGWRIDGKQAYDIHEADYGCEKEEINETIDRVLKKDDKKKQREKSAIEFMGTDKGSPRDNILSVLNNGGLSKNDHN